MINKMSLKSCVAASALVAGFVAATPASAGSFAVREQSAYYQGMSFAGAASGSALSSMFWNPAATAAAEGINFESHAALLIPDSEIHADGGLFVDGLRLAPPPAPPLVAGKGDDSGDISDLALVPSSYANYQVNDRLFLGLAINSPFGLTTKPDNDDWAGSPIAETSKLFTVNVNPTLAYKVTPTFTVGIGVQVQYIDVELNKDSFVNAGGVGLTPERKVEGDDFGVGATAGVSWQPREGTTIGIGYRSPIEVNLEGDYDTDAFISVATGVPRPVAAIHESVKAEFTLPEMVSLGFRQNLTERLALLGTVEWTNWSRLSEVDVKSGGETVETLAFNYDDGWFYSVGLEYLYSPKWTFRIGVAYEESPITDKTRNVLLPDDDRIWLSVGATHKYSDRLSFDVAYTHIFVDDDSKICRAASGDCENISAANPILLVGEADSSVDIVSASVKYKFSQPEAPLEPLK